MTSRKLVGLGIAFVSATALLAASLGVAAAAITLVPVLTGLASPVFVTNARDGTNRLFIVEQGGVIRVLQPGATSPTVFLDISSKVLFSGEQGLLGLAFHPQFSTNRRFFVDYVRQLDGATVTVIAEYQVSMADPNVADSTETVLLVIPQPFGNHKGGMVEFGPDGFLYIGMGDGGSGNDPGNRAQDVTQLLGKILRIDVDHPNGVQPYSSPPSNPFFGSVVGADEIYAYGLRNPWRFSFDRGTGDLYAGDVGQSTLEEIDIITLGGNYGWRIWEGTQCSGNDPGLCNPSGFTFPIAEYGHTGGRCAITGGYVYRGAQSSLPLGSYVYGDYCTGELFVLQGGASSVALLTGFNISSFGEDETGELYVVNLGGTVHRLACDQVPSCTTPVISVTPSSLNFGVVTVGTTKDLAFTAKNIGVGTVTGSAAASGAPFSVISGSSFTLGAGASQAVTVRFGPTSAATFVGNVSFTSNAPGAPSPSVTGTGAIANPTLTVNKSGAGTGTVTSNPAGINCGAACTASFQAGTPVTLTAVAGTGWIFTGWSGAGVSCPGTGTCTVTLTANTTVIATFNLANAFTLTVGVGGSALGTVTSNPSGINCSTLIGAGCSATFSSGTVVMLTETSASDAAFKTWRTDCTGPSSSTSVSMTTNRLCQAIFSQTFTDPTLIARSTTAKVVHVTELRAAIDRLRIVNGLGGFPFTDDAITATATLIKGVHISDLRTALCAVYGAAGLPCPTYATDPTIAGFQTTIKAQHLIDLRSNVRGLE